MLMFNLEDYLRQIRPDEGDDGHWKFQPHQLRHYRKPSPNPANNTVLIRNSVSLVRIFLYHPRNNGYSSC